jgi:hypothetical protein
MRKGWMACGCVLAAAAAPGAVLATPTSPTCKVSDKDDCEIELTVTVVAGQCVVNLPAKVMVDNDRATPRRRQITWHVKTNGYTFDATVDPPVKADSANPQEALDTWTMGALSAHLRRFTWVLNSPAREHLVANQEITYAVSVVSTASPPQHCTGKDPVIGNGKN